MGLLSQIAVVCVALSLKPSDGFSSSQNVRSSSHGVRNLFATATQAPKATAWSPTSWRNYPIKQPPNYPDAVWIDSYHLANRDQLLIVRTFIICRGHLKLEFTTTGENCRCSQQAFKMRPISVRGWSANITGRTGESIIRPRFPAHGWWLRRGVQRVQREPCSWHI